MKVKLLQVKEATRVKASSAAEVYRLMKEEAKADREIFFVLHLNTRNEIIEKEIVSIGTLDSSLVHPREVFRKAVINSSSSIICVHNHPSGDVKASVADKEIARQLFFASEIMGIGILDFIIIGRYGYYSFDEDGIVKDFKLEAKHKASDSMSNIADWLKNA